MNKINVFKTCERLIRQVSRPKQNIRYNSGFGALRIVSTTPGVRLLSSAATQISSIPHSYSESSIPPPEPDVLYRTIQVEIRSSERAVLKAYAEFITMAAGFLDINQLGNIMGRKKHIKRWTVLKSVFVHKKHMVQYEVRTYHYNLVFARLTGSTADTFLEYIQRNLPEGVAMKVTREQLAELPEHLRSPPPAADLEVPSQEDTEVEQTSDEKGA